MEALRRTLSQYTGLFNAMSPSQRATLVIIPLMIAAAFGFLMLGDRSSSYVPLSFGKVFTSDELSGAEQTLRDAGMNDFRRDGQRIIVPRNEAERYNAALLEGGSLPENWASELEKQFARGGLFTSNRQYQAAMDIAVAKELNRVIRVIPDIEYASVIPARPKSRSSWRGRSKVTAVVNVRPRRGRKIQRALARSLRMAVAGGISGLNPADVTVFNLQTGESYMAAKEGDPYDNRFLTRQKEFEDQYQAKIADALSYIPNVLVTVDVELTNLKSSFEESQTFDPKKTVPVQETNESRVENPRQLPIRSEPGVTPNQPKNLESTSGGEKSRTTETTSSNIINAASVVRTSKQTAGLTPKSVRVTVAIPKNYYRSIALRHGRTEGESETEKSDFQKELDTIEKEEEEMARKTVTTLIPNLVSDGSSPNANVDVKSVESVEPEVEEITTPFTVTMFNLFSRWGGAVGLALFAVWALWMVNKSMSKLPTVELDNSESRAFQAEEDEEEPAAPERTRRDELQTTVRDNPEMAAAVLSKWIQAAK